MDLAVVGGGRLLLFTRAASLLESADTPGGIHLLRRGGALAQRLSEQETAAGRPPSSWLPRRNGQLEAVAGRALRRDGSTTISRLNGHLDLGRRPGRPALRNRDGPGVRTDGGLSGISLYSLVARRAQGGRPARIQSVLALAVVVVAIGAAGYYAKGWMARASH